MIPRKSYSLFSGPVSRFFSSVVQTVDIQNVKCHNDDILSYKKGSKERQELTEALYKAATECPEIPIVIGEEEICTGEAQTQVMPHNHSRSLAKFYYASEELINKAIKTAVEGQKLWGRTDIAHRIKIWEKAADLMSKKYRQEMNAAIMLGQSKTVFQAEIDTAEMVDFLRFHSAFLIDATRYQPLSNDLTVTRNSYRYRGLEGFIAAISPFNFCAIGGNLAYTPALLGNCVLWKPADTAVLSNFTVFKIMREAGVPPGVVNFVTAEGPTFGDTITDSPYLAGINFTGSPGVFQKLWGDVGTNIKCYKNFPRLVGECGGKNFHFVHPSADIHTATACTIRSAFEYSGQKCSACSRLYVPESLWPTMKADLIEKTCKLKVGDVCDFSNFTSAVIDELSFERIQSTIDQAKKDNLEFIVGGDYSKEVGYFIEPTIIQVKDPFHMLMTEEIFGPVIAVYVYKDAEISETMALVDSSKYALTGAVFATDNVFLEQALDCFMNSAGNFYINDKSTGAVVGQQPFGGARLSGTNDKAGGPHYILRFTSPQTIKETFTPLYEVEYPYMLD